MVLKVIAKNFAMPERFDTLTGNPDTSGPSRISAKKKLIIAENISANTNENIKYCLFPGSENIKILVKINFVSY